MKKGFLITTAIIIALNFLCSCSHEQKRVEYPNDEAMIAGYFAGDTTQSYSAQLWAHEVLYGHTPKGGGDSIPHAPYTKERVLTALNVMEKLYGNHTPVSLMLEHNDPELRFFIGEVLFSIPGDPIVAGLKDKVLYENAQTTHSQNKWLYYVDPESTISLCKSGVQKRVELVDELLPEKGHQEIDSSVHYVMDTANLVNLVKLLSPAELKDRPWLKQFVSKKQKA